jgi:membrane-associated protease RseP (regulator of RpoE activity)
MRKQTLSTLLVMLSLSPAAVVFADNSNQTTPAAPPAPFVPKQHMNVTQTGWLGVTLAPVPPALAAQLSHVIPAGQGVLVGSVTPDSPAAKAGLQANDVLLTFNDQQLYSSAQLAGLVRGTAPQTSVQMSVVQKGQLKSVAVDITARPQQPVKPYQQPFWQQIPNLKNTPQNQAQNLAWDSFESVQVKTLPDGRYHAKVSYKDQRNETRTFTFEGEREEIIEQINQQINQQTDLPDDKKQALLNALNMQPGMLFPNINRSLDQFFQQPLFQQNPFDDPFFKQDFHKELSPLFDQLMEDFGNTIQKYNQQKEKEPNTITL